MRLSYWYNLFVAFSVYCIGGAHLARVSFENTQLRFDMLRTCPRTQLVVQYLQYWLYTDITMVAVSIQVRY